LSSYFGPLRAEDYSEKIMRWYLTIFMLVALKPLLICDVSAAERTQPIRIGVLTDSWGPTPGVVGLRDGLRERGYRENQDFVIGVRFTQGDIAALPQPRANSWSRR
jgi:hypothetical protein